MFSVVSYGFGVSFWIAALGHSETSMSAPGCEPPPFVDDVDDRLEGMKKRGPYSSKPIE